MLTFTTSAVLTADFSECIRGADAIPDQISFLGSQKCARDDHSFKESCLFVGSEFSFSLSGLSAQNIWQ